MLLKQRATLVLAITGLCSTACGDVTPPGAGNEMLWEVDGEMSTAPSIVDSVVVMGLVNGQLIARHRLTSRTLWQRTFSGAEFRSERLLSVGDIVIAPHSQLYGVDVRTGVTRWTFAGQRQTAGVLTPTLSGDTVFVAGFVGGTAAALDAKTGAVLWRRDFAQTVFSPSVGTDLVIYPLRSDSLPNELVALDRVTGEIRWRSTLPDSVGWPSGANAGGAIIGDRTIVATLLGRVSAFRLSDGELLWTRDSGNPSRAWYTSRPMVLGDVAIIMRTGAGNLQAWSRDGELEWTAPLGDGRATLIYSPRPCGPHVCFAIGRVSIVDAQGRILWTDGGGSGAIFLSNVTASDDGIMYAGVYFNASRRGRIRAFRPAGSNWGDPIGLILPSLIGVDSTLPGGMLPKQVHRFGDKIRVLRLTCIENAIYLCTLYAACIAN